MITFAAGVAVGIVLSVAVAYVRSGRIQHEHKCLEDSLRSERDSLSLALKDRNDKLFEVSGKFTELQKEVAGLYRSRVIMTEGIQDLLDQVRDIRGQQSNGDQ